MTKEAKEAREFRVASTQFVIAGLVALTVYAVAYNESGQRFWARLTEEEDVQTGVSVL